MSKWYWLRVSGRNLGMLAILVVVWRHSHWSVALSITLLSIAEELRSILEELQRKWKDLRATR